MIYQRIVGDFKHLSLQILQVFDAHNLLAGVRIDDYEIPKAKAFHDRFPQILRVAFRVFVYKRSRELNRISIIARLRRLQDKRNDQPAPPHISPEHISRKLVLCAVTHKAHVRYNSENIVFITFKNHHRLLIVSRKLNLWPPAHPERPLVGIKSLLGKFPALFQHKMVEMSEGRRIEPDGILNQQNRLHPNAGRIVLHVHIVLHKLDNRDQQLRVAQPTEHIVNGAKVFVRHPFAHLAQERRKHHDGNLRVFILNLSRSSKNVAILHVRHADDKLKNPTVQLRKSLLLRSHLHESRRVSKVQRYIFVENLFVHAAIVLQHKSVILSGDKQNIVDTLVHQVRERSIFQHKFFEVGNIAHGDLLFAPKV